jgi:hypothetical protein
MDENQRRKEYFWFCKTATNKMHTGKFQKKSGTLTDKSLDLFFVFFGDIFCHHI